MTEMTAEQRSQHLFDLFSFLEIDNKMKKRTAQRSCALILVSEIMKDLDSKSRDFVYWSNVKYKLFEI
jgi:hypothetical protein